MEAIARRRQERIIAQSTGVPVIEEDIVAQHGCQCFYCGERYQTLDHVWPIDLGGPHDPSNLVPSCQSCNNRKSVKHLLDFVWKVLVPEGVVS